jgi:hypothetical protein
MAPETYSLEQFVADLDRITDRESAPAAITAQVAPLLGRLVRNDAAIRLPSAGVAPTAAAAASCSIARRASTSPR